MLARTIKAMHFTPPCIRCFGKVIPPRKLKLGAHLFACVLLSLDVIATMILAASLPHALIGIAGLGGKLGAAIESVAMFIQEEVAH